MVESDEHVVVLVRTASGRTLSHRLNTPIVGGGRLSGRREYRWTPWFELVVGTSAGAHTLFFTTVTYRAGRLVRGPGREWVVDASYSSVVGVKRRIERGRAVVVLKDAVRDDSGARFSGRNRAFVWRRGAWHHQSTVRKHYRNLRAVNRIGGWQVRGLPPWPP